MDEGQEKGFIAPEAELVVAGHLFGWFIDFDHHFVLGDLFAQFEKLIVLQPARDLKVVHEVDLLFSGD